MFAFLLVPGIQQKLQVLFNDTLDITQVTFISSNPTSALRARFLPSVKNRV